MILLFISISHNSLVVFSMNNIISSSLSVSLALVLSCPVISVLRVSSSCQHPICGKRPYLEGSKSGGPGTSLVVEDDY